MGITRIREKTISEDILNRLKLEISELRLSGLGCGDVLTICKNYYQEADKWI